MRRIVLSAFLSHWRRNPLQLVTFLAGLALATALWSGVQAINAEARASYEAAAATLGEGQYDQLVPRQGDLIAQETYIALRRAGWLVSPVVEGRQNGVRLVGVDRLTLPETIGPTGMRAGPADLAFLQEGVLFATSATAERLETDVQIIIDPDMAPGVAMGDVGVVQRLLGKDSLTRLIVLPDQPRLQTPLGEIAPDLRRQESQQSSDISALTDSFHLNLTAFGLLSFAVGLFIVHSAMGLAFEQRRGMIRTLRALGVPLRVLVRCVVAELLLLAAVAGLLGVLLGYLIAGALLPDVAATLRGLYGANVSGALNLRPDWWLSGLAVALLGASVAMAGHVWQLARMPALAAARPRAWALASETTRRWQALGAGGLLTLAVLIASFGQGLYAGFAVLACLLMGTALALPLFLDLILRLSTQRARRVIPQWFWADTRQQLPGLSLALMALLLAVAANVGVSTMVSSFRLTFIGFLDQRLAPELFLRVETEAQSRAALGYLEENADEVLPLLTQEGTVLGRPTELFGIRVGQTYRDNWSLLGATEDPWDQVAAGEAVVVNEQLARRAGLWAGDAVEVVPGLTLSIAGVVGDYGNPVGQVVMSETVFRSFAPDVAPMQFGIRTKDVEGMRAAITRDLGFDEGALIDQATVKAFSLEVFERTFTVTGALNVLTLGVAAFAMLMSLLTLADLRVPQLAPVWALGLRRRSLARLELVRAIALGFFVCLLAVPLGLVLAWVLLAIVNVEAFGWRLPMFLFPAEYTRLVIYAMIAAALAAAWPALRLVRHPANHLLKVFAHES